MINAICRKTRIDHVARFRNHLCDAVHTVDVEMFIFPFVKSEKQPQGKLMFC